MTVHREQYPSNPVRNLGPHFPWVWLKLLHQWHSERPTKLHGLDVLPDCLLVRDGQSLQPSPDGLSPRACQEEDHVQPDVSNTHAAPTVPASVRPSNGFLSSCRTSALSGGELASRTVRHRVRHALDPFVRGRAHLVVVLVLDSHARWNPRTRTMTVRFAH